VTDATPDGRRILVLDDEELIRRTVGRVLRQAGYDVQEAATPTEAREIIEGRPVDLLLCDLALEGLQGREAAIMLQARRPEMRVLYMSGSSEAEFREELEQREAVFLAKPFELSDLLAAVRRTLGASPQ